MRRILVLSACVASATVLGPSPCETAELGDELLQNGSFETSDPSGQRPASWTWQQNVRWETDGESHWIVEEATEPASLSTGQRVPMEEEFWKIRVSCRVRVTSVAQGAESWHDARIAMSFYNAEGDMVGAWPNVLHFTGTMRDWETHQRDYIVPGGAAYLDLTCSLFSTTGKVEWDDASVKLLKFDPVPEDARLPDGVVARWDLDSAVREETPTRGRVCINGLWRFHPVPLKDSSLPQRGTGWGYLKVPGTWAPGVSRQRPIGPDIWEERLDLRTMDAAWYQRNITVPDTWAGRRILFSVDNPKHSAKVLVDGKEAGKVEWPGGRVEITDLVAPGRLHELSVYTLALPLKAEEIVVMGPDVIEKARAAVRFKGLCGDCWLESEPAGARVTDVFVKPSVRRKELRMQCELRGLDRRQTYTLRATVFDGDEVAKEFASHPFQGTELLEFAGPWQNPELWDIDQPNLYTVQVALLDGSGRVLDQTTPMRFGFREFWIEGKDFYLNGSRIHLRCLDYFNAGRDFGLASYRMAQHTLRQARKLGFNYVIHSHYDYDAQSFAYIDDTLRAGDELGFPMSYSIRHVKRIYRDFDDPGKRRLWNRVVDYEVRRVRNHPCVFMWAMNHNFTGWRDDQSPGQLDGAFEPAAKDDPGLALRRQAAALAEEFVMERDGTRPCYHHQSGSFNQMTTLNCYLCWTPLQERTEWISRWREGGVKPLFFVEFGLPHQASWGGHREGPFIWRNNVSSEPLVAEFGAIYNGDRAYELTDYDVSHYDTVERVYARGEPFHIHSVLGDYWTSKREHNFLELKSLFTRHTWPAFRTYGLSALLPWDQADLFGPAPDSQGQDVELATNWDSLQRPGLAPDYLAWTNDWLTCPRPEGHIEPTSLGEAFARVNRETLAFIAGPPERFTAEDHVFASGDRVTKQIVVVNDLRQEASVEYSWHVEVGGQRLRSGSGRGRAAPGSKFVAPLRFRAPSVRTDTQGAIELEVEVNGKSDETTRDAFAFTVLPKTPPPRISSDARIACYDPKGLTKRLLRELRVRFQRVEKAEVPKGCSLFIIGREAVGPEGPPLDVRGIAARGTTMLIFEQTEEVLQKHWGFRTASPGTRRVFVRQPGHPICSGLTDELLRDWRGNATLLEAYPERVGYHGDYPRQSWCGFDNSRTWQWGNYGCVSSVVIEKPQRGNFSFLLDCEFDLQYTPLFEWLAPEGRTIFCQLDLTGRDAQDPVAARLLTSLLEYAASAPATDLRPASYAGNEGAQELLADLGVRLDDSDIAVVGPGADAAEARARVEDARTVVCLGLPGEELAAALPFPVTTQKREVTHTLIGRPTRGALVGLGNSDFHWRGRMTVNAIAEAPEALSVVDTGVFAEGTVDGKRYVLVQFLPTDFDYDQKPYLKLSFRRAAIALARILTNCGVLLDARVGRLLASPPPTDVALAGTWRFKTDAEAKLLAEQVSGADFDVLPWREVTVPGLWEGQAEDLADYDGIAWYRKEFALRAVPEGELTLCLGAIDDEDWTYLNGKLVGHIGRDTHPDDFWAAPREYAISGGHLRPGRNVLVVKVNDHKGGGGIAKGRIGILEPGRWLASYYLDEPTALDDPYRYNRW